MAPDPTPNMGAPDGALPLVETDGGIKRVVATQSSIVLLRSFGIYVKELLSHTEDLQDVRDYKSMIKLLDSIDGFLALACIYVYSPTVSESERQALAKSLHPTLSFRRLPTRNAIASTIKAVLGSLDTKDALRVQASRIVAAAMELGLVVVDEAEARGNRKPLRGTERLSALMTDANVRAAFLMREALSNRAE